MEAIYVRWEISSTAVLLETTAVLNHSGPSNLPAGADA
jgi:hypothetical protein